MRKSSFRNSAKTVACLIICPLEYPTWFELVWIINLPNKCLGYIQTLAVKWTCTWRLVQGSEENYLRTSDYLRTSERL